TSITVDTSANVIVVGHTSSTDFPVVNATQTQYGGGALDAFLMKLGYAGNVIFSTYMGGSDLDNAYGVTTDVAGNIYITGVTLSMTSPSILPEMHMLSEPRFQRIFRQTRPFKASTEVDRTDTTRVMASLPGSTLSRSAPKKPVHKSNTQVHGM